jgi:hypothetical protein
MTENEALHDLQDLYLTSTVEIQETLLAQIHRSSIPGCI